LQRLLRFLSELVDVHDFPSFARISLEGVSKGATATPTSPGIEIAWLPTVVPTGPRENETAVPEGTTVGSPGFQSRATSGSQHHLSRHPLYIALSTSPSRGGGTPIPPPTARTARAHGATGYPEP